ncbi:hypothetical protein [Pontibacter ramchanderi]|nr:hypothetical protein [Pontibacter ramchanderi]
MISCKGISLWKLASLVDVIIFSSIVRAWGRNKFWFFCDFDQK